jgi:hypothetical protein
MQTWIKSPVADARCLALLIGVRWAQLTDRREWRNFPSNKNR